MARIRHIAIVTEDVDKLVRFYTAAFGLKIVPGVGTATYLSDGHVNLAILKFRYDDPATTEGAVRYTGIHHFGLEVENLAEARARFPHLANGD